MRAQCPVSHERYFIVGSCATRDAFDDSTKSRLLGYVARTSFGSAFARRQFPFSLAELDPDKVTKSAFQRRMIGHDLAKELSAMLSEAAWAHPLLIVDFIDERFPILTYEGAVATYSLELKNSGCLQRHSGFRLIPPCSEEHFELWSQGFLRFAELVKELDLCVLVNAVFWAARTEGTKSFDAKWIDVNNRYLAKLYSFVSANTDFPSVSYEGIEFVGSACHRWGDAPYHYRSDVYDRLLGTLGLAMLAGSRPRESSGHRESLT